MLLRIVVGRLTSDPEHCLVENLYGIKEFVSVLAGEGQQQGAGEHREWCGFVDLC